YAAHDAAVLQEWHLKSDFGTTARAAQQNTGSGRHQRIDGFPQYAGLRGSLEREAHAAPGDLADFSDHIRAATVIERVCRTELTRQHQPSIVHIDRDNGIALRDPGRH